MAVAENDGPTRIIVCVTLVPSVVTSVLTSRSSASPELTKRTLGTLSAASLAASSSAIFSSIGTSSGSRANGRHPGAGHRRDRRELDAALPHDARGPRHGGRVARGALRAGARHGARRGEAPAAVHERADAEAVRLAVADAGHLTLARRDGLPAIAADAHVGVRRAGLLRGVERFVGDLEGRRVRSGGGSRLGEGLEREGAATRPASPPWPPSS